MDNSDTAMDPERVVDRLVREYDITSMTLPGIEAEPHLLISKVRKHYMEYIIKLLTGNYENNQKLLNKNIYLPSAIWRCAKKIETNAAQTCMVAQLYRKNIVSVIEELKNDTNKGRLNKRLFECLHRAPENEKNLQTTLKPDNCTCQCSCDLRKRPRKVLQSPQNFNAPFKSHDSLIPNDTVNDFVMQNKIPVIINSHQECQEPNVTPTVAEKLPKMLHMSKILNQSKSIVTRKQSVSAESQDSDDVMMQLEKIFEAEPNDDDLFDGAMTDMYDTTYSYQCNNINKQSIENHDGAEHPTTQNLNIINNHSARYRSLDERLASLTSVLVTNTDENVNNTVENKLMPVNIKKTTSKWVCEEYYRKRRYYELLNDIGDDNMRRLARIKAVLLSLFGDDSDEDGIITPLDDDNQEFVESCKKRIASIVVKILSSYYNNGQIKGKVLFKALAKHLIKLIYKCKRFPHEHEVQSFLDDFMAQHKTIRRETDLTRFTMGMEPFKI